MADIKKLIKIILFGIMIYLVGIKYITQHESIHQIIYSRYNIETKTDFNLLTLSAKTNTFGNYSNCNDSCKFQNSMNDIIGYNIALLIFFLTIIFIFWWSIYEQKKN